MRNKMAATTRCGTTAGHATATLSSNHNQLSLHSNTQTPIATTRHNNSKSEVAAAATIQKKSTDRRNADALVHRQAHRMQRRAQTSRRPCASILLSSSTHSSLANASARAEQGCVVRCQHSDRRRHHHHHHHHHRAVLTLSRPSRQMRLSVFGCAFGGLVGG